MDLNRHGEIGPAAGCFKSMSQTLGQAFQGRDNHFNLMRAFAAVVVLFSHSYPLAYGDPMTEPLRLLVRWSLGDMAVDVFFVLSGFLVTHSLFRRADIWSYTRARILRIYPAMVVATLVTVAVLGWALTTLSSAAYWTDGQTWKYLHRNMLLFAGIEYDLPGLFETNPYARAVNGSLWTMPYELRMYALLLAGWAIIGWLGGARRAFLMARVVPLFAVAVLALHLSLRLGGQHEDFYRLVWMFFAGSALWLWRDRIALWPGVALAGLALVAALAFLKQAVAFYMVQALVLPYAAIALGLARAPMLLGYNRLGDYSYGLYIYAFPIQQAVALLWPGVGPVALTAIALPATLFCAVLSWHGVEKPALGWRGFAARRQVYGA